MIRRILVPGPMASIEPSNPRYDHNLRGVLGLRQLKPLLDARHGPPHKAGLTRYRSRAKKLRIDPVNFVTDRRLVLTNAILRAPTSGSVEPSYSPLRSLY